ncbi:MAG: hypothetical protein AB4040_08320 [Synechococcus sp.]
MQVALARQLLPGVAIARHQIAYLVSEAERAQVEGHRGELCAVWVAKARAALSGRTIVNAEDLQVGVELAKDGETLPEEFEIPPKPMEIDPTLLNFARLTRRRRGKAGGGNLIFSQDRGRYVKPMFPNRMQNSPISNRNCWRLRPEFAPWACNYCSLTPIASLSRQDLHGSWLCRQMEITTAYPEQLMKRLLQWHRRQFHR